MLLDRVLHSQTACAQRAIEAQENRARKAEEATRAWEARQAADSVPITNSGGARGKKRERSTGTPFQRVGDEWNGMIKDELRDNSYVGTFGNDGWGAGANEKLSQVRGKDFRHEKTKKKRGSYRGGSITLASNSFKYED